MRKKKVTLGRRLLADLQWAARENSEYLLSARDCKALVAVLDTGPRATKTRKP